MEQNEITEQKLQRATNRVRVLKGFYLHVLVFVAVNTAVTSAAIWLRMQKGESLLETLDFASFATPFFWGIGLFFHGLRTYELPSFFSKRWEANQIEKYMKEDTQPAKKNSY